MLPEIDWKVLEYRIFRRKIGNSYKQGCLYHRPYECRANAEKYTGDDDHEHRKIVSIGDVQIEKIIEIGY